MSTRLATILGVARGTERAPDSHDTVRWREPTAGSEIRTKGALYLVADVAPGDARLREAARDILAAVEADYYHDLTAGVAVTLRAAVAAGANRLRREVSRQDPAPRAGISAVAVHGREAHIVRCGTATALIVREGRIYEVSSRDAARPADGHVVDPSEWHGEMLPGDRVALVSRDVVRALGPRDLRQALISLRPQAATDRLRDAHRAHRGSDHEGFLALEFIGVPATKPPVALEPVRPPTSARAVDILRLSDVLHRWSGPARRALVPAQQAARAVAVAVVRGALAVAPRRGARYPTGTPRTAQRRASSRARLGVAGLAAIAVLGAFGGTAAGPLGARPTDAIPRAATARASTLAATELLSRVEERISGSDLVTRDPDLARALLADAGTALERAVAAGIAAADVDALATRLLSAQDRLDSVTRIAAAAVVADLRETVGGADASDMVAASDGSLWILDQAAGAVLRVDPASGAVTVPYRRGQVVAAGTVTGGPWAVATAATDVVVIDRDRRAWRIDLLEGIPRHMEVAGLASIGAEARASLVTALQHQPPLETFALYAVDPASAAVVRWLPPPVIPVSFPAAPEAYLVTSPDLDPREARDLRVDVSGWLLHSATVTRIDFGTPLAQADYALAPAPDAGSPPDYRLLDAATLDRRELLLVYDRAAARILAFAREDGAFVRQWRAAAGSPAERALRDARGLVMGAEEAGRIAAYVLTRDSVVRLALD